MKTTSKMTTAFYNSLDLVLGHIPKRVLFAIELVGAGVTILGVVDIVLRVILGIATVIGIWYTVKSQIASAESSNASKEASIKRAALDELQIQKLQAELEAMKTKGV